LSIPVCKDKYHRYSFHYNDPDCLYKFEQIVYSLILNMNEDFSREIVFLCVGTDRATGDCLGPLIGTRLKTLIPSAVTYGTLEHPAHATNLSEVMADISSCYKNPLVIAVDACLGTPNSVGFINVKAESLRPGSALKKTLPEVGDFCISGVVNVGGFLEPIVLQNTRLHIVYKMANIIVEGLILSYSRFIQSSPPTPGEHNHL